MCELAVVVTSVTVEFHKAKECAVLCFNFVTGKNLVDVELCNLCALSLKTCNALAVQPALATECRICKVVSTVGCLELECVLLISVVLADELSALWELLVATSSNSKCTVVVVDVELVVTVNGLECVSLASLWENYVCSSVVSVDSSLEGCTCLSVRHCYGNIDSSLQLSTWSSSWVTDTLESDELISCSDESNSVLVLVDFCKSCVNCVDSCVELLCCVVSVLGSSLHRLVKCNDAVCNSCILLGNSDFACDDVELTHVPVDALCSYNETQVTVSSL